MKVKGLLSGILLVFVFFQGYGADFDGLSLGQNQQTVFAWMQMYCNVVPQTRAVEYKVETIDVALSLFSADSLYKEMGRNNLVRIKANKWYGIIQNINGQDACSVLLGFYDGILTEMVVQYTGIPSTAFYVHKLSFDVLFSKFGIMFANPGKDYSANQDGSHRVLLFTLVGNQSELLAVTGGKFGPLLYWCKAFRRDILLSSGMSQNTFYPDFREYNYSPNAYHKNIPNNTPMQVRYYNQDEFMASMQMGMNANMPMNNYNSNSTSGDNYKIGGTSGMTCSLCRGTGWDLQKDWGFGGFDSNSPIENCNICGARDYRHYHTKRCASCGGSGKRP